jgi:hypothetical protein
LRRNAAGLGHHFGNPIVLLLAFHIVAVAALIAMVGSIAYRLGVSEGERRARAILDPNELAHELSQKPNSSELSC